MLLASVKCCVRHDVTMSTSCSYRPGFHERCTGGSLQYLLLYFFYVKDLKAIKKQKHPLHFYINLPLFQYKGNHMVSSSAIIKRNRADLLHNNSPFYMLRISTDKINTAVE